MFTIASTLSVNLGTGVQTVSDVISARSSLTVTLTNVGSHTTGNMRAALYRICRNGVDGTLVATCNTFTAFVGAMSLNTTELIVAFTDLEMPRQYEKLRFDLLVWDASDSVYIIFDHLDVSYENTILSTAVNVSPISTGTQIFGNLKLINGIVNLLSATDQEYYPLTAAGADTEVHVELGTTGTP